MADGGFSRSLLCCCTCERIGAAPHGLLGCSDCLLLRARAAVAKLEEEHIAALNAHDEFPLSLWREYCEAANNGAFDVEEDDGGIPAHEIEEAAEEAYRAWRRS